MNGFRAFLHFSVQFIITLSLLSCILYSAGVRSHHVMELFGGKIPVKEKSVEEPKIEPAEGTTSEESGDRSQEIEGVEDSSTTVETEEQMETSTAQTTTETESASMSTSQTEAIEDVQE